MNRINQHAFMVRLHTIDPRTKLCGHLTTGVLNLGQSGMAIDLGLPLTK